MTNTDKQQQTIKNIKKQQKTTQLKTTATNN